MTGGYTGFESLVVIINKIDVTPPQVLFQPAPNPESYSSCSSPTCPFVLRRLDASSLTAVAERPIVGHRQLVVRPGR